MQYVSWLVAFLAPLIAIFIAMLFLRKYLPSYFSEKGKNLATKEDIGEITRVVEAIRAQHSAELEVMKAAFGYTAAERSAIAGNQRAATLQFLDACTDLLLGKLQINLGDLPIDGGNSLAKYQQSVADLSVDVLKHYYRLLVYLESASPIAAAAGAFITNAWKFRPVFRTHFGRVKLAFIDEGEAVGTDRYADAVKGSDAASEAYYAAAKPLLNGMADSLTRLVSAINEQFKGAVAEAGLEAIMGVLKAGMQNPDAIPRHRER
jgi:hypothetical protein